MHMLANFTLQQSPFWVSHQPHFHSRKLNPFSQTTTKLWELYINLYTEKRQLEQSLGPPRWKISFSFYLCFHLFSDTISRCGESGAALKSNDRCKETWIPCMWPCSPPLGEAEQALKEASGQFCSLGAPLTGRLQRSFFCWFFFSVYSFCY